MATLPENGRVRGPSDKRKVTALCGSDPGSKLILLVRATVPSWCLYVIVAVAGLSSRMLFKRRTELIVSGERLRCLWSGVPPSGSSLAIDIMSRLVDVAVLSPFGVDWPKTWDSPIKRAATTPTNATRRRSKEIAGEHCLSLGRFLLLLVGLLEIILAWHPIEYFSCGLRYPVG